MALTDEKEKYDQLAQVIEQNKDRKGPIMPVMQAAQNIFGHVSFDVQKFISEKMNLPMSDLYGVATFYSQFSLQPKGEHIIGVCLGTACYVKGVQAVMDRLQKELGIEPGQTTEDGLFTLEATRCLGCCGLAPVMMIDDQVYGNLVPGDVPEILNKYRK